jgi:hypothetical protein
MTHASKWNAGMVARRAVLVAGACALAGCHAAFTAPPEAALDKLLRPVTTSPESVRLEVFEARIPLDQDQQVESLWNQVDELCLDADLRRRMLANGLRAGVVGGALPDELSKLLGLTADASEARENEVVTAASAVPRVTQRVMQLNRRDSKIIQVCDLREEAQILFNENDRVGGRTYRQVEGRYELRAESLRGQRVSVRLVPELHHGELRNRFSGDSDQGQFLITPSREREAFEQLAMAAELLPGEMLVVGCLPQAESSLGGVLHMASANGRTERKFLMVRLLETPPSEILAKK